MGSYFLFASQPNLNQKKVFLFSPSKLNAIRAQKQWVYRLKAMLLRAKSSAFIKCLVWHTNRQVKKTCHKNIKTTNSSLKSINFVAYKYLPKYIALFNKCNQNQLVDIQKVSQNIKTSWKKIYFLHQSSHCYRCGALTLLLQTELQLRSIIHRYKAWKKKN